MIQDAESESRIRSIITEGETLNQGSRPLMCGRMRSIDPFENAHPSGVRQISSTMGRRCPLLRMRVRERTILDDNPPVRFQRHPETSEEGDGIGGPA